MGTKFKFAALIFLHSFTSCDQKITNEKNHSSLTEERLKELVTEAYQEINPDRADSIDILSILNDYPKKYESPSENCYAEWERRHVTAFLSYQSCLEAAGDYHPACKAGLDKSVSLNDVDFELCLKRLYGEDAAQATRK